MTTRELSDAIGVSESSLKRWIDAGKLAASRTEGGHRRVLVADAMRFIRAHHTPLARPELLDLHEISADRARGERLATYLVEGDEVAARGYIVARYLEGAHIADLADGAIREAMYKLGELWNHDDEGIFIEHRGTEICLGAIAQLLPLMPVPARTAPYAVGGAPPGDPYLIPSTLAGLTVAEAGMNAINLGPDTPFSAFEAAIARHHPKLLWISVSAALAPASARALAKWLGTLPKSLTVVVGGQQAHTIERLPRGTCRVGSMAELSQAVAALE